MQSSDRYIIGAGISFGFLSMLYFLSLVSHMPFLIALPFIAAGIFGVLWWLNSLGNKIDVEKGRYPILSFAVLIVGVVLMLLKVWTVDEQYGGWDAWCFWNVHAKYIAAGPAIWQKYLLNTFAEHTEYPLLVPGVNGFFMHLFPGEEATIPFIFSFIICLFIPVLLYVETLSKNIFVAAILFLRLASDNFFITNGVSQYADLTLAFFFLCAAICLRYANENRNYILLCAACLGCCFWTKNEGIVLVAIFIAFHVKQLFAGHNKKYFAMGIAPALLVTLLFKIIYAPANDLVAGLNKQTLWQIFMPDRYKLIYASFSENMNANFFYLEVCFLLYIVVCIFEKKWPSRLFFMLTTCIMAYMMIYILSSQYLPWHLATSLPRLLLQLCPAIMYVFSQRFVAIKRPFSSESSTNH